MLHPPRKLMYALEAVVDIAHNARPDPVQSKAVTRRQGIPHRYLEQVMQHLVHTGILKGVRGPKGGYTLARERRRITVGEVVRAIDQLSDDGDEDNDGEAAGASPIGRAVLGPFWNRLYADFIRRLDEVTLEELCRQVQEAGIKPESGDVTDFNI